MTETTETSPRPSPAPPLAPPPAPPGALRRVLRWFWVPLTPREGERLSVPQRQALSLAQASLALCDHALDPDSRDPLVGASARCAALGALRTAAYWALRAHQTGDEVPRDLPRAFEACAKVAAEAAETDDRLASARAVLVERGPAEDAVLDETRLEADALLARDFVRAALREPEAREATRRERWMTRATRVGLAAAVVAGALAATPTARRALKADLAKNAVWRTSTSVAEYPQQGRGFHPKEGAANIFFQTQQEAEPWIEFDLESPRTIELVGVQNRLDCCHDWSVPLVIEHSVDHQRWTEVGRRVDPFHFWTVTFPPTRARYVRLRVPRETTLHLGAVQIK